ncbi:MAG: hypothetical protein Q4A66_13785, partial [Eubacteriales bacterium]|nr:hypothetical protein [Eubacteriales bacterium]
MKVICPKLLKPPYVCNACSSRYSGCTLEKRYYYPDQAQKAYELMSKQDVYKFIGNVEARDTLAGGCDVLAADGFVGNVVLKNTEGVISALFKLLKEGLMSSTKGKVAALLAKDTFKSLKRSFDSTEIGGVPLLGVEGAVIK